MIWETRSLCFGSFLPSNKRAPATARHCLCVARVMFVLFVWHLVVADLREGWLSLLPLLFTTFRSIFCISIALFYRVILHRQQAGLIIMRCSFSFYKRRNWSVRFVCLRSARQLGRRGRFKSCQCWWGVRTQSESIPGLPESLSSHSWNRQENALFLSKFLHCITPHTNAYLLPFQFSLSLFFFPLDHLTYIQWQF